MNDFYDPFTHPENSTLPIDFMLMTNAYGVSSQSLMHSLEAFNSANCVNASFRDRINEEIAKTCILTIEHDTEGTVFYGDNMPYETVGSTISESSKTLSSTAMTDLYVNKVVANDILLSNVPIALRNDVEQRLKEIGLIEEIDDIVSMAKYGIISSQEARYRVESMKSNSIKETKTNESEKWVEVMKDLKHGFTERTDLKKEKAKTDNIYAGDGFIMRTLRKLIMAANTVIGWIVDELTYGL